MTGRLFLLWAVVLCGSLVAVGLSGRLALRARAAAERTLADLHEARSHAEEIVALRASAPAWTASGPPSGGLATRIGAALQAAGLPATALASLSAERDMKAGSPELRARRRRATVTLAGVTLPRVGALLAAWREREPGWTVEAVDLVPEPGKAPPHGGDLPLRATLVLEAMYIADDADGGELR